MENDSSRIEYIGDGVYAYTDGYHLILKVSNGAEDKEPVFIEPQVWDRLKKYLSDMHGQLELMDHKL